MPTFFVPHAEDEAEAEEVWQRVRKSVEKQPGWEVTDRRIFRLEYTHDGEDYVSEVGREEKKGEQEPVFVILESNTYLVCTPNRGVDRGLPILVGRREVSRIVDFD